MLSGFNYKQATFFKQRSNLIAIVVGILIGLVAFYLVSVESDTPALSVFYGAVWILCAFTLSLTRRSVLSPFGAAVFWYILCFLVSIPVLISEIPGVTIKFDDIAIHRALLVSSLAFCSFLAGCCVYASFASKMLGSVLTPKRALCQPSNIEFLVIMAWIIAGTFIRLRFNIGQAGVETQVGIPIISGLLDALFNRGSLALVGLFSYRALSSSHLNIFKCVLLTLTFSASQSLLGWKDGLAEALVVLAVCFWFQSPLRLKHEYRSVIWLIALIALVPLSLQIGHAIRGNTLGRDTEFASTYQDFAIRVILRLDGNDRLATVLRHETDGAGLSLTNREKIIDIKRRGITVTKYADWEIHGVDRYQKHSVGASGPGGAYIGFGVVGVIVAYLSIGIFYRTAYNTIRLTVDSAAPVVFYGILFVMLRQLFAENIDVFGLAKQLIVILIVLAVYTRIRWVKYA